MSRTRKKKDYTVRAVVKKLERPVTVVFTQKAYQVERAHILAYRTLVRHGLWIKTVDVLYPGRADRDTIIELKRQNHVRKLKGFVFWVRRK